MIKTFLSLVLIGGSLYGFSQIPDSLQFGPSLGAVDSLAVFTEEEDIGKQED